MKKVIEQEELCQVIADYEKHSYIFSPSIGKRKTIGGKSYFVRGVFRGGQDFEQTMKRFAKDNFYKNGR